MDQLRDLYTQAGPFASVLADVSLDSESGEQALDLRARAVADKLEELGAPERAVEQVRALLSEPVHEPAPRSRFVVATADSVLLDTVLAERTGDPSVTWGALPDVGRLLALREQATSVVLVSVDHSGGSVTTYDSHQLEATDTQQVRGEEDYVHKVGGGGWAHRRFQATSEEVWRDNAREVADLAVSTVRSGQGLVVVAGSAESRGEVVSALEGTKADVVVLDRAGENEDGGEEALQVALRTVVEQHLEEARQRLRESLEEGLGQQRGAVAGLDAVLDAFVKGQVDVLVADLDALADDVVRPSEHPGLDLGVEEEQVRADLALVAAAVRTDARVVAPPHGFEHPVAALLRWDDQRPAEQI